MTGLAYLTVPNIGAFCSLLLCVCFDSGGKCLVHEPAPTSECLDKEHHFLTGNSLELDVLLDEIRCDGHEQSLAECHRSMWKQAACGHKEDAGCICDRFRDNSTSNNDDRPTPRTTTLLAATITPAATAAAADNGPTSTICDKSG